MLYNGEASAARRGWWIMDEARLRRKIAVIMAADVAGYSRLVAEDEEGALKRLMEYREIFADFVGRGRGRIFNTAGDAVLAEFDSAVEAVRAAMDIQEALKTRNALIADNRRMVFRIGVSLGDVVERDGDLLGDGVNIAARLQGLAVPGGICVSRAVQEQVVNKVSILFRDIGAQSVKNIPHPVHAFMIGDAENSGAAGATPEPAAPRGAARARRFSPLALGAVTAVALAMLAGAALLVGSMRAQRPAGLSPAATAGSSRPAPGSVGIADGADAAAGSAPKSLAGTPLKPMEVPFVTRQAQQAIERQYVTQTGPKALAIAAGVIGMSRNAPDEPTAKAQALDQCETRASAGRKCALFAIGDTIVWDRPAPRLAAQGPLAPRFVKIAAAGPDSLPFIYDDARRKILDDYLKLSASKALVAGPFGAIEYVFGGSSIDDVIRRVLQICADRARGPCLLIAVGDDAVTRMPQSMQAYGLLDIDAQDQLPAAARQELIAASEENS
jgi:class 3 adenylate cyclase